MNKTKAAIGAAAIAAASAGSGYIYRISESRGGNVQQFVSHFDQLRDRGARIVIDGPCNSSCTMALGYPNTCLTPRAVLGFHPAYVPLYITYLMDWPDTRTMIAHYPSDAYAIIRKHGRMDRDPGAAWSSATGYYPKLFYVKGSEFPARYQCKPV